MFEWVTKTIVKTKETQQREIDDKKIEEAAKQREREARQKEVEARQREIDAKKIEEAAKQREEEIRKGIETDLKKEHQVEHLDPHNSGIALEDDWTNEELELDPSQKDIILNMRIGIIEHMLHAHDITMESESIKKWKVGEKKSFIGKEKFGKKKGQTGIYEMTLGSSGYVNVNIIRS